MLRSSESSSTTSPSGFDGGMAKVRVRGLHSDIMDEDLESYFETPKSGGKRGSVVQCIFEEDGTVCVEFNDTEGKYAQKEIADLETPFYTDVIQLFSLCWYQCTNLA